MRMHGFVSAGATVALVFGLAGGPSLTAAIAQEEPAAEDAAVTDQAPAPLSQDEMEVLVARIALYPDDLVAVISAASLYPLQIVEAARFLDDYDKDNSLKPKDTWDGSVISLLNYPEVLKMMSDDLDWTQTLGDAIAYQQKDVLVAIQQLRDEAVAKDIIKTDDKMTVTQDNDNNVVIQSAAPDTVYVPQYEPQMLYVADYPPAPIGYYPNPYPYYYDPTATFFAAAATGALWAAAVDWNDWDVWGGPWHGGDIDIDCDHCFNNRDFDGKINFNDANWKNIDRSKIKIDRDQFANIDRDNIRNNLKSSRDNSVRDRATSIKRQHAGARSGGVGRTVQARDVRKSTLDGLKGRGDRAANRPDIPRPSSRPNIQRPAQKPAVHKPNISKPAARPAARKPTKINHPVARKKPAARADHRPTRPSGLGHVSHGKSQKIAAQRGHHSMGGGRHGGGAVHRGGGGHRAVHRGGGRRR
ncbi:DUF3300 domain-containing protein [Mesorhizobium xinjiangense]|uniref:DUF3300 domain-containing protein n=1 Tax=Mesorhizobium xinjiangense TaxID=2678685 RepID=UPI001F3DA103|nr:DUF3300 domain-containing protein [Mesorhizobium xinjiangense]